MKLIPKLSEVKWLPRDQRQFWIGFYYCMQQMQSKNVEVEHAPKRISLREFMQLNPDLSLSELMRRLREYEESLPRHRPEIGIWTFFKMHEHLSFDERYRLWLKYLATSPIY